MGKRYPKIFLLTFVLIFCLPELFAQTNIAASVKEFALPVYNRKGDILQCILYGDSASILGDISTIQQPRLDIVSPYVKDISVVKPLLHLELYKFGAPSEIVERFWKQLPYSQAVVFSSTALFYQSTKTVRGDKRAWFFSPFMDITGIGFDAFFKTKFIHIRSKVCIILRLDTLQMEQQKDNKKR